MKCPNCGRENPSDSTFCNNCGQPLAPAGPRDDRQELLERYIPASLREKIEAAGSLEGQRRQVTILFADVVGSTALAEKRDPEEAKIILEEALSLVMAQVSRYEGLVADLLGDGLLAFFGAPIAHEDDPERATRAALDIQEALSAYGEEIRDAYGVGLQVRVGINTGPVVVGEMGSDLRMEYTAMGDAVNLASRMESEAPPGGILITEATHRLTERLFTFEPQGKIQVKGREEPVEAYLVTGLVSEPASTRGIEGLHSPMVGRDQEQAQLMEAVENLVSGKGQIVTVMGEAGIGKTRLIQETREASSDKDILWLEGRALSYGQSLSLFLFQDLIRNYLGVSEGESPSLIRVKLKSKTRALFGDREAEIYPYLASLLSIKLEGEMQERIADLHPEALKRRIFVVVGELLERVAQDQPVAVILEDLHWADPTSIELLKGLLPSTDRAPILLSFVARPVRDRPWWSAKVAAETDYPHRYGEIAVHPLPEDESSLLVQNLLAVEEMPTGVRRSILDKTEGNPFFLEEVVRALIDEGVLVRQDGRWRATSKILSLEIPDTVQGVIRSRIDRLEEEPRKVLQIASVIGKSFLYPVLEHVATMDGKLDESLAVLQRLELIEERARLPEVEYGFKHVLTQEVAYSGLLKGIRTGFHQRVAESIEALFPDRLEEFYGMLGHHWSEAGESEKAVGFLLQAGDRARLSYSHQEAEDHYSRALEHQRQSKDDKGVAKTLFRLGLVHHISGDFERVNRRYEEAFEIWQAEGAPPTPGEQETLRLGHWVVPGLTLDPGRVDLIQESKIVQQLFQGLAQHDADGNVVPAVARSWEISEDGTRYLFHLRPGLQWSDGKPVAAGDFEYAWKRNLDPATEARLASNLYPVQGARPFHQGEAEDSGGVGVRAIDDATLEVHLEAPTAYFLHLVANTITYPLPRWAIEAHGDRWTEPGKIVTNGPFMLAEYSVGNRLVMVRNPAHPGPFPGNLGRVEWHLAADRSDYLPLYEAGDVDVAPIPESELHLTRQAHPSHARSFPTLGTWHLRFDVGQSPFDDPRVRRSFILAADRDELAGIFQELPARGGLVPPGMPGHSAEVGLSRDPEQARRTLSQAGYPDGKGFPQVRLLADTGRSEMANRLAAQWQEHLGIRVEIEALSGEEREDAASSGSFHLHLVGWVADYPDPDNFLRILFHSAGPYSEFNWRSEEFDRWVDQAARLSDQIQRLNLYQRAEQMLVADQVVAMPISHVQKDYLVRDWVRNFRLKPLYELDLREVIVERP